MMSSDMPSSDLNQVDSPGRNARGSSIVNRPASEPLIVMLGVACLAQSSKSDALMPDRSPTGQITPAYLRRPEPYPFANKGAPYRRSDWYCENVDGFSAKCACMSEMR